MMMFPLSKLAVDLSAGAKEDQGVLDFAAGQVVRRSKSAKAALPCMLAACVYSGFVIISECTSDGGLVVSAGPPQLRSLAKAHTAWCCLVCVRGFVCLPCLLACCGVVDEGDVVGFACSRLTCSCLPGLLD